MLCHPRPYFKSSQFQAGSAFELSAITTYKKDGKKTKKINIFYKTVVVNQTYFSPIFIYLKAIRTKEIF